MQLNFQCCLEGTIFDPFFPLSSFCLVLKRIVADVSDHQRSRPSIMTQNYCEVKWGFVIGSKCFVPQPKVKLKISRLFFVCVYTNS